MRFFFHPTKREKCVRILFRGKITVTENSCFECLLKFRRINFPNYHEMWKYVADPNRMCNEVSYCRWKSRNGSISFVRLKDNISKNTCFEWLLRIHNRFLITCTWTAETPVKGSKTLFILRRFQSGMACCRRFSKDWRAFSRKRCQVGATLSANHWFHDRMVTCPYKLFRFNDKPFGWHVCFKTIA